VAYEALDILRSRLSGFFMRRERSEVLDQLPPRTDNTFWTEMTPTQLRPYRRHARRWPRCCHKPSLENRRGAPPVAVADVDAHSVQRVGAVRMGPRGRPLKEATNGETDLRWIQSPKLEEFSHVLEDLLERPEAKVLVFSQWERLLRLAHYAVRPLLDGEANRRRSSTAGWTRERGC
jgi:SNF2 family DNA or RNA helicase